MSDTLQTQLRYIYSLTVIRNVYMFICMVSMLVISIKADAQDKDQVFKPIAFQESGKLLFNKDSLGNRIPDFSFCGYKAGEIAIPEAKIKIRVPLKSGDATQRIQEAINELAQLPLDKAGLRGAVLLDKGNYEVWGTININASGIVLRGSGFGEDGTTIIGKGDNREILVRILGKDNQQVENPISISPDYVPVNSITLEVNNSSSFKVGDQVIIHRPSTKEWIDKIGTYTFGGGLSSLGWKPGQRDIYWDRKIVAVKAGLLTLDAPLTTALDKKYGQATVAKYTWSGRISNSGIENLNLVSDYNKANLKDEDHRWTAISIENAEDIWVRQMVFKHFAGSAVFVQSSVKKVTIEDCKSLAPVSEIGGERRNTFYTKGQQTLFQRLFSEHGYHDFAVGFMAAGPNAFVQCQASLPYSFSGTTDSWASGVLFDNIKIDGHALQFANRGQDGQGAGWTAANSVFWQCSAAKVSCYQPPTAQNWAYGIWAQFEGDGYWDMSNEHIKPRSLYYAQLTDRLGENVQNRTFLLPAESEASSSPSIATALELTLLAAKPAPLLTDFIDQASSRTPLDINASGVKVIKENINPIDDNKKENDLTIENGLLVNQDEIVTGNKQDIQWWSGSSRRYALEKSKPHITRFVPGETGLGLTDNLEAMTDSMKKDHILAMEHNYGLWYDRRRDDHQRVRRMDGEVWPPFYEQPFARSGEGTAWDGLSKYDLTKYNKFYWSRLKEFANLADKKGLILLHQNYFQHNIIEAGAHYADFPWRPANNINNTGFPEPAPYAGDKRIFLAQQFYDINHPKRRELHRAYIRQCLENFKDNAAVIQLTSAEYTGPLHFVEFWLDVINEWEQETGKNVIVGLSTTKDVQDAILADKNRSKIVDVIDIRYWYYQENGEAYAPKGGQNLAPRQHARLTKAGKTSFEQIYRSVQEYRLSNPDKAVIYNANNYDKFGWAIFMGGGSMANLPQIADQKFYKDAATMQAVNSKIEGQYSLAGKSAHIIYNTAAEGVSLNLPNGNYSVNYINSQTGNITKKYMIKSKGNVVFNKISNGTEVIWISKN